MLPSPEDGFTTASSASRPIRVIAHSAKAHHAGTRTVSVGETRERILASARELYERVGSRGTTTRAVANGANVNEATLFRHFGTKRQLISTMIEHFSESSTVADAFGRLDASAPIERQLGDLAAAAIDSLRRKENLIKVAMAEEITNPAAHRFAWRAPTAARRLLNEYFAAKTRTGELRGDPDALARTFLSLPFSYVMARALWNEPRDLTQDHVVASMVDIFLNGVRSK